MIWKPIPTHGKYALLCLCSSKTGRGHDMQALYSRWVVRYLRVIPQQIFEGVTFGTERGCSE